jgi:hypothetical protein
MPAVGAWTSDEDYEVDPAAQGVALQQEFADFWSRLLERLLGETEPFDRVAIETEWDGPRFIAYAVSQGRPPGHDTGWRLQCFLPESLRRRDRIPMFVSGAGRAPALAAYRSLKRQRPGITFWDVGAGDGFRSRLPL